ncbi:MAG TPA: DUF2061 domain-containing protein [Chitinophagaceae bacterium]|nr:DUF2061 domain-containing protein [Chitinophagaceae bacterium]
MFIDAIIKQKRPIVRNRRGHLLSLGKAVSWRIVGTLDTILISYLITGQWNFAISIGSVEVFTKIFLFYLHDRVWEYFANKEPNKIV